MPEPALRPPFALGGRDLPAGLSDLPDAPRVLHVAGTWPAAPMVAIVGARASTEYGRAVAHRLASDLARLGFAIVSGLARGIDAAAHEGALDARGVTVAVLPGSLDRVTPPSHTELARRIARRGALAAEWEAGMPAARGLFLRRNRLIAALARATVVVEAAEKSGALATAGVARRLGRPVLAVPGDIDRPTSRGCHALLRLGARVCEGPADVLAAVGAPLAPSLGRARGAAGPAPAGAESAAGSERTPAPEAARDAEADVDLEATRDEEPGASAERGGDDAARVAAALAAAPRSLEALAARAGLAPERTLAALTELEWAGVARAHPGARWSARAAGGTP